MRQLLVAVGFLAMLAHSAEGQGTVFFSNITPDFAIEKPVVDASSGYLLGEDYVAQLFAGPAGSSATDLRSVDSPAYFLSLANQPSGIFFGGIVTLPGILPGRIATVEVRVGSAEYANWYSAEAASHQDASVRTGRTGVFQVQAGTPENPADLARCMPYMVVGAIPEPGARLVFSPPIRRAARERRRTRA